MNTDELRELLEKGLGASTASQEKRKLHAMLSVAMKQAKTASARAEELHECEPLVDILTSVTSAADTLIHVNTVLQNGEYTSPRILVLFRQLSSTIRALPGLHTQLGSGQVCTYLREEEARLRAAHKAHLEHLLLSAVSVNTGSIRCDRKNEIQELWVALSQTGTTIIRIKALAQSIWTQVIMPLWSVPIELGARHTMMSSDASAYHLLDFQLAIGDIPKSPPAGPSFDCLVRNCCYVVNWIFLEMPIFADHIRVDNSDGDAGTLSVMQCAWSEIGCRLSSRLRERLLEECKSFGKYTDVLSFCNDKREICRAFDELYSLVCSTALNAISNEQGEVSDSVIQTGIVPGKNGHGGQSLESLLETLPEHFCAYHRRNILTYLKNKCVEEYGEKGTTCAVSNTSKVFPSEIASMLDNVTSLGDSYRQPPICYPSNTKEERSRFPESFQISEQAACVVQITEALAQLVYCLICRNAGGSNPDVSSAIDFGDDEMLMREYGGAIVDCLELFLSLIPSKHSYKLETSISCICLWCNDCAFLASYCAYLRRKYKVIFIHSFVNASTLIALVPRLQFQGNKRFQLHLESCLKVAKRYAVDVNMHPNHNLSGSTTSALKNSAQSMSTMAHEDCDGADSAGSCYSSSDDDHTNETSGPSFGIFRVVGALAETVAPKPKRRKHRKKNTSANTDVPSVKTGAFAEVAKELAMGLGLDRDAASGESSFDRNSIRKAKVLITYIQATCDVWRELMSSSQYVNLARRLIDSALRVFVDIVLSADTIDVQCADDIRAIFAMLSENLEPLLCIGDDGEVGLQQQSLQSWNEMSALNTFLDCSLTEIAELLPLRTFRAFTVSEMMSLVRAVFEESSKRQAVLQSISEL